MTILEILITWWFNPSMSSLSHHCISIFQSSRNFLFPFLNFFHYISFLFSIVLFTYYVSRERGRGFGKCWLLLTKGGGGVSQKLTIADEGGRATFWKNIVISTAGALRIGVVRDFRPSYHPTNHPFIAFEHLSLKRIQASLWHYVAFSGKVNHGRPRYSQVQSGTVRYSQVQCWKDPSCAIYFWKASALRISNSRNRKKINFLK